MEDPSTSALFLELVHQGDCAESIEQCQEGRDVTHRKSPKAHKLLFSQTWSYFKSVKKAGCRHHKGNPFLKQITTSIVVLNPTLTCPPDRLAYSRCTFISIHNDTDSRQVTGCQGAFQGHDFFPSRILVSSGQHPPSYLSALACVPFPTSSPLSPWPPSITAFSLSPKGRKPSRPQTPHSSWYTAEGNAQGQSTGSQRRKTLLYSHLLKSLL